MARTLLSSLMYELIVNALAGSSNETLPDLKEKALNDLNNIGGDSVIRFGSNDDNGYDMPGANSGPAKVDIVVVVFRQNRLREQLQVMSTQRSLQRKQLPRWPKNHSWHRRRQNSHSI
ncbi:unnamed protein product [Eruca vesicaria subsp. sativa]|uniref:Uncharacterized protein n=1 Tax=Eruca vesicaria subsp. sativa TaxID=29727 RepID=A0ABC8M7S0_ERUVS|nr:unnamed protein product [Eruca vesicaria subsp. sativa]